MYAIVEIAGQQFKVAKDQKVFVHRLDAEEGKKVTFDKVMLLDNDGKITVGAPEIEGAAVEAKVIKHLKGDKVIVFKKKRRKGYRVKNGHRQFLTQISIENIISSGAKKPTLTKAKAEKPEEKSKKQASPKAKTITKAKTPAPQEKATPAKPKAEKAQEKPKKQAAPKAKAAAKAPEKEAKPSKAKKEVAAESEDLSKKTVAQLKEMAKAKGITGISSMKKADLIAALSK